ncbi:MAG: MFS transporter [Candidatus Lokiarchaeota archaeon]|nr:MFS transporter [Candidatus Lokiarchaeota archaeon]
MSDNSKKFPVLSIILFILIITLINSVQNMISPNLLTISSYFGFGGDTAPLGFLTFNFMLFTGITMLIFGYLADKIVRKWIVFIGSLIFSLFSSIVILIPEGIEGYRLFFLITILTGIGYGAVIPSIFSLMGDLVSKDERAKGFSFFSIASLFGTVLGTGMASFIGEDWRFPFFIVGLIGLIGTFFFLLFKEPSRLGMDQSILLQKDGIEYTYRIRISDIKTIFQKKSNIWLVVNFVDTIPTGIILTLLFAYMEVFHGINDEDTSLFLVVIILSIVVGTIFFGYIGDNWFKKGNKKARVLLALFGNIAPIPFLFIGLIIPFQPPNIFPGVLIWIILFSIGMFTNGAVSGNWYASVADLNLPENRGTVIAAANFFDIIGRALGPLIGTIIADTFGFLMGMMTSIFAWLLIPFFWIPILRNAVKEIEGTEEIFNKRIVKLQQ